MGSKKSRSREASARLSKRLSQIQACEQSGETLKTYAARHRISVHGLYQAKKQARQKGLLPAYRTQKPRAAGAKRPKATRRPRFVEAVVAPAAPTSALAWRLCLRSGDVIESNTPLGYDETLRLIHALRDRP